MEENLINDIIEEEINLAYSQEVEAMVETIEEEATEVLVTEIEKVPDVTETETIEIIIEEGVGYIAGQSGLHSTLPDRNNNDQHIIEAITGLREELDFIESPRTIESNGTNVATYYKWANGAYDTNGYFVSISDGDKIQICGGTDIFGVVVDDAGFVGNQIVTKRDNSYGLVITSGLVDVRCELDVDVGDFVTSNSFGCAKKSSSNYGYRVLGIDTKDGVPYAIIALGIQADVTNALGAELNVTKEQVDTNYKNIISAINVANQAYNKVNEIDASNKLMSDKVDTALGVVDKVESDVENLGTQVSNSALVSAQAKAIAESAATSATSMRNEAVAKANEALSETSELRKDFEELSNNMSDDLSEAVADLQDNQKQLEQTALDMQDAIDQAVEDFKTLEKDLEPLATWPEGATGDNIKGIAGFVAQADEDSATLASMVVWKGDAGDSLAGFVQEATEENATVKSIASYNRKDENGNAIEPGGAAGLIAQVDANQAVVQTVAALDGGIAGLEAKVENNTSSLTLLTSQTIGDYVAVETWSATEKDTSKIYYVKDKKDYYYYKNGKWNQTKNTHDAGLDGAIAGVQSVADDNKAQLDAMVAYDKDGKSALAGLTAYVDENSASISTLAKYSNKDSGNSGIAGLVADVDDNTSTLSVVAQHSFTKDDGTVITGLAGLQAQVDDNTSEVSLVSKRVSGKYVVVDSWNATGKDSNTVYYDTKTKLYWYYDNNTWKSTNDASVAGLPASIAGIQVQTDANSSSINSLTSWSDDTDIAMARIEQKADANGAYIQSTVSSMDKYAVGPYSQAYGFTLEQAESVLEEGMIYVPTESVTEKYEYIENDTAKAYERSFTRGYLYRWGKPDGYPCGWITVDKNYSEDKLNTSAPAVYFATQPPSVSGEFGYWYTEGNAITDGYEPYTLYKWESYTYEDGDNDTGEQPITDYHWVAVATLAGNSSNRAVSQIRQDTNSIELRVTNTEGSAASSKQWIDDNSSNIQDVVSWKSDNGESLVTFMQTADENFASASQVAQIVDKDGSIKAASIVTAVNESESSVVINADHIKFEGSQFVSEMSKTYSTKDETKSLIDQKADSITLSVSQTYSTKDELNDLEIGGRNLVLNSNQNKTSTQYQTAIYDMSEDWIIGDTYTISIKGDVNEEQKFGVWANGAQTRVATLTHDASKNIHYATFEVPDTLVTQAEKKIYVYNTPSDTATESSIEWIKLEKGDKITDWTPAPEDMVGKKEVVASINASTEGIKIEASKIDITGSVTFSSFDNDMKQSFNNTISSTVIEYALSKYSYKFEAVEGDKGNWNTQAPTWDEGTYMWQQTTITYTDTNKEPTVTKTCIQGAKGGQGDSAYTIVLTNESHTFSGATTSYATFDETASTSILAYDGDKTTNVKILKVNGVDANTEYTSTGIQGLSFMCSSIDSASDSKITFKTGSTYTDRFSEASCSIPILVEVDGKQFTKTFSCSIAFKGANATTYWLTASDSVIHKDTTPTTLTLTAHYKSGSSTPYNYYGRWKISYTISGLVYLDLYESEVNEYTVSVSVPNYYQAIRCQLYAAGGTTTLLDEQTIPIVSDGNPGKGVNSVVVEYHLSNSADTEPTSDVKVDIDDEGNDVMLGWTSNFSTIWEYCKKFKYIWLREVVTYSDGSTVPAAARVDNASKVIADWCVVNDKTEINGAYIATGTLTASQITTGTLGSNNHKYTDGNKYTEIGTLFNLDTGELRSKSFSIDNDGNAYFKGKIETNSLSSISANLGEVTSGCIQSPSYGEILEWDKDNVSTSYSEGLAYTINSDQNSYAVTGIGDCVDTNIIIPNTYNNSPVTIIGSSAFENCKSITRVDIPDSVTKISEKAFRGCEGLTSIIIPDGVTSVGPHAFYECRGLTGVVIPSSVTSIGNYAFSGCSGLIAIYYKDTENKWSNITIGSGNENLDEITRYYYSKTKPITNGNYWHYSGFKLSCEDEYMIDSPHFKVKSDGSIESITSLITEKDGNNNDGYASLGNHGLILHKNEYEVSNGEKQEDMFAGLATDVILDNDGLSFTLSTRPDETQVGSIGFGSAGMSEEGRQVRRNWLVVHANWGYLRGTWTSDNDLSDARFKNTIESLPEAYETLFDNLQVKRYKYNHGTSGRFHTGYIAQEVVDAINASGLTTNDFAGVMLMDAGTECEQWHLRRDEFVSLNTWQIQKLKARVSELEKQIELLTNEN